MVVHVLGDVAQEACRYDADCAECNADIVDIFVGLRVRDLTCEYDGLISARNPLDAGKLL